MNSPVLMSLPEDKLASRLPGPRALWTLVGLSAIPLWALWPLFAVISGSMPVFEFSAIIYTVGAATLFALRSTVPAARQKAPASRLSPAAWLPAVMVSFGMLLQNVLFLHAVRYMPAAQANLIVYLWPVMVVVLASLLRLVSLRRHHLLSVVLALAGAAFVVGPDLAIGSWAGIGLALTSGLAWAVFCVYRLWQGPNAPDALAPGLALSAVIAIILHACSEPAVMPGATALLGALLDGAVPLALGNLAWDNGIRRGDKVLLAVAAYATPLVSAVILIAFGLASPSTGLFVGGVLIVAGGLVSTRR
jgi:drug/metabolite transporter (DMT)-like permease